MVRGGDVAEEGPETIPLTKAAQKFQLLWRDDSAAPQSALSIFKAIAPPGYAHQSGRSNAVEPRLFSCRARSLQTVRPVL